MADYERLRERHFAEFSALVPEHLERLSWPVERIREERERRLRALLAAARERSSWHAGRFTAVDPATATEADLTRIPPMTKDDMMEHLDGIFTDPRLSRRLVEAHVDALVDDAYLLEEFHVFTSGGSSGRRGLFVYDWNGWMWFTLSMVRFAVRERLADPEVGLGVVEAVVAAEKASHMTGATTFFPPGAPIHRFPSTLPLAEIVAGLNRVQPAILRGYPTALAALAAEARAGRLRIAPRAVRAHSEPLLPELRRTLEETWGRPVGNGYGTTEGAAGISCGQVRGMHLNEDLCIFELVDEAGKPVPTGERCAKLFITNLSNLTQPLIRYELTDELRLLDEPCPCGSAFRRHSARLPVDPPTRMVNLASMTAADIARWTELARTEGKGADPAGLVWHTPEGIDVKPLYTAADVQDLDFTDSTPGTFPFTRGPRATMYAGQPWTIRQYAVATFRTGTKRVLTTRCGGVELQHGARREGRGPRRPCR